MAFLLDLSPFCSPEIFHNAIDHSDGSQALIIIGRSPAQVSMLVADDGIGIFEKIKSTFDLEDHRHAILELAKGKLTTDDARHSGEDIFFTPRMFDHFSIASSKLVFAHDTEFGDDWLIEDVPEGVDRVIKELMSTVIRMSISAHSKHTTREVFEPREQKLHRGAERHIVTAAPGKKRGELGFGQFRRGKQQLADEPGIHWRRIASGTGLCYCSRIWTFRNSTRPLWLWSAT
jgi:hypothetical protein